MIPQHMSNSREHRTPSYIVEPARELLGGIDLDPASCLEANETVRATQFYSEGDDGLSRPWTGRVFLNPPGGKLRKVDGVWVPIPPNSGRAASSLAVWWAELARRWTTGEIYSGFFVSFNLEILRASQSGFPVQQFARCYPHKRIRFTGSAPTHANLLVYLAPRGTPREIALSDLRDHFGTLGFCEAGA